MNKRFNIINDSEKKYIPRKEILNALENTANGEKFFDGRINLIILDKDEMRKLNREYLQHDYDTDVISFNFEEEDINGEIYIGIDMAMKQANEYKVTLTNELKRLAVHGFLHILGHDDSTDTKRSEMKQLEDKYIQ
jgi:probable rRNA maturation factor